MCRFAEICAGISPKVSENLKAYILQAIAANEGTDCRFVLNSKEIERFSVAMHMKISLRAAFVYLLRYKRIGYNLNIMRQSAYLVFNPITVDNYAAFFNCTPVGRASDSMMAPT